MLICVRTTPRTSDLRPPTSDVRPLLVTPDLCPRQLRNPSSFVSSLRPSLHPSALVLENHGYDTTGRETADGRPGIRSGGPGSHGHSDSWGRGRPEKVVREGSLQAIYGYDQTQLINGPSQVSCHFLLDGRRVRRSSCWTVVILDCRHVGRSSDKHE